MTTRTLQSIQPIIAPQRASICKCSSSVNFTNPLQGATSTYNMSVQAFAYIHQYPQICMFPPYQANSVTAHRRPAVCTRCWKCPTRERTCPWWSFFLGRKYLWPPWSPSLKHRCWRSGLTMSNDRRWKSTYRGETFIYVQVHSPPLTYVVVCFASFICHLCAFRPFTLYSPLFESQTQL